MANGLDSLEERVKKLVAELFKKNISEITEKTSFVQDLNATSIDSIALLAGLEGEFKLKVPPEEILQGKTVGTLIEYLKKQSKES